MTAVLTPMLGLPAQAPLLDASEPERASRSAGVMAFGAVLSSVLPKDTPLPAPMLDQAVEADLKPRAKLGIWPTQPARFSPPKRGSSTMSSAPAGPDDGPSSQPLQVGNAPNLEEHASSPVQILGPRLDGQGAPQIPTPPPATPDDLGPAPAEPAFATSALDAPLPGLPPRRNKPASPLDAPDPLDALLPDHRGPDAPDAPDVEPAMFADPFLAETAADEGEPFVQWEDLVLSRVEERSLRVEFDHDLAVEVRASHGDVDVHLDGTWDALHQLGDIEYDLEQALADGGEHQLASYSQTPRRDPTARPQGGGNRAESEDGPATEASRVASGGRLFNGIA